MYVQWNVLKLMLLLLYKSNLGRQVAPCETAVFFIVLNGIKLYIMILEVLTVTSNCVY